MINSELVFGHNPEEKIVAVEADCGSDPCRVVVFSRGKTGVSKRGAPFRPFMIVENENLLEGLDGKFTIQKLAGGGPLKIAVSFQSWPEWERAKKRLVQKTGKTAGAPDAPFIMLNDPVHQHLVSSGRTFFKGMDFEDVRRMQIDIETHTAPGFEFSNPFRAEDRIIIIAMRDSAGWEEILAEGPGGEKELLKNFVARVRERDPDVIEGHNIFKFDLPYISARAERHKVDLKLGRGGETMRSHPSRFALGERMVSFAKPEIYGRHVVDTYFLLQAYDLARRSLESLSLKAAARHFGLASGGRVYIEGDRISGEFDRNPERVARYARDDVREIAALSNLLSRTYFVQAGVLPFSYQNICLRGNAAKIDALLLRAYLRRTAALPYPGKARKFEGGYTDIFREGVIRNVHHCDVSSLYPSIMLVSKIAPDRDELGLFPQMLAYFREYRLEVKRKMRQSKSPAEKHRFDSLQSAFKILINSFYGYLGFAQARFNDFNAAERVAAEGRAIIKDIINWLKKNGADPVEADTDGIYFVPPEFKSENDAEKFRGKLSAALPAGIDLEFDGEYPAMFSYKIKNYALLTGQGEIIIKGAALKSRGLEPYLRSFLRDYLRLKLESRDAEIPGLKTQYGEKINKGGFAIAELAKTETLKDAPATYAAKIAKGGRGRNAAYELALRSGRAYEAGDHVSYYIAGTKKNVAMHAAARLVAEWSPAKRDENLLYYQAKLEALYKRLQSGQGLSSEKDADG
ncbi:MAG: DNA polymerase domain-containing protein [Kiritimatiellae bacterium]|nr:DNA polymerase domain-containing protein [Kiritimatiellia bacterium]